MEIFHNKQLELFKKMQQDKSLAHAYLFTGPEGIGKLNFARNLALFLQGQPVVNVYGKYNADITETSIPLPIKEAKELKKKLNTSPYLGKYKIVIINQAENMHIDAANSLLKMIEEPSDDTIFLLLTAFSAKILATIKSRCYEMKFSYIADDIIKEKFNTSSIGEVKEHWTGRPAFAKEFIDNEQYYKKIKGYRDDCEKFIAGNLNQRFEISQKYGKIKHRSEFREILRTWMEYARMHEKENSDLISQLLRIYKIITTTNANPQFIFNRLAVAS